MRKCLTLKCVDENGKDKDEPIVFSEWAFITGFNIQRSDYTFDQLLNQDNDKENEQMSFDEDNSDEGVFLRKYVCNYRRIWENG